MLKISNYTFLTNCNLDKIKIIMSKYLLLKIILIILVNFKFLFKLILQKIIDKIYILYGGVGYYGNLKSDLDL